MPRADVITNPISGRPGRAQAVGEFRDALVRRGWDVRVLATEHAGHGAELARNAAAAGADAVVAAGGDGTVNVVVAGLLAAGPAAPPLAILARGTSNLVARDLGIPLDPAGAAAVVAGGACRRLDTAAVGGRTMVACAGVGWDAHVVRTLAAGRTGHIRLTTWLGPIRAALRDYRFPVFRVATDGAEPVDCVLALFLNCRPYARFLRPAPDARPDDGLLDAVLVRPPGRGRLGRLAWRAWRGTMAGDPSVVAVRCARADVTSDGPVPVQIDGDDAGETPADVAVRPGAIRVLVPARA